MKFMWKGFVYESKEPLSEGFLRGLLPAVADGALKGMGFGELPGQARKAVTPPSDKKNLKEGEEDNPDPGIARGEKNDAPDGSPYWGRKAAGAIFYCTSTGNVLFGLRSGRVAEPHTWAGFGGKLDGDETPIEGLERELMEEIGYEDMDSYVGVCVFQDEDHDFEYYSYLVICNEEFQPNLNDETSEILWTSIDTPPEPLHPNFAKTIPYYKSAIRKVASK